MKKTAILAYVLIIFVLLWPAVARVFCGLLPATATGHVLLVSDIHFDPLADPAIVKRLIAAPASQWQEIFASSAQNDYAHAPDDANFPLLKSALSAAVCQGPFRFLIGPGGYFRHRFPKAIVQGGRS